MGQGGSEPGPCRDEIIPQDGEGTSAGPGHMHSDVTSGFSSQWKHGVHFTVRAAQSLFLADLAAALPLLFPASVHSSQGALCFHHSTLPHTPTLLLCSFVRHALPVTSGLFVHSFSYLYTHLSSRFDEVTAVYQALS